MKKLEFEKTIEALNLEGAVRSPRRPEIFWNGLSILLNIDEEYSINIASICGNTKDFGDFAERLMIKKKAYEKENDMYQHFDVEDLSTDHIFEETVEPLNKKIADAYTAEPPDEDIYASIGLVCLCGRLTIFSKEVIKECQYDINIARKELHKRLKSKGVNPTYEISCESKEEFLFIMTELNNYYARLNNMPEAEIDEKGYQNLLVGINTNIINALRPQISPHTISLYKGFELRSRTEYGKKMKDLLEAFDYGINSLVSESLKTDGENKYVGNIVLENADVFETDNIGAKVSIHSSEHTATILRRDAELWLALTYQKGKVVHGFDPKKGMYIYFLDKDSWKQITFFIETQEVMYGDSEKTKKITAKELEKMCAVISDATSYMNSKVNEMKLRQATK